MLGLQLFPLYCVAFQIELCASLMVPYKNHSKHFQMIQIVNFTIHKRQSHFLYLWITYTARCIEHIPCVIALLYWIISATCSKKFSVHIKTGQTEYEDHFYSFILLFFAPACPRLIECTVSLSSPCVLLTIGENTTDGNICKLCHRSHTITGSLVGSMQLFYCST